MQRRSRPAPCLPRPLPPLFRPFQGSGLLLPMPSLPGSLGIDVSVAPAPTFTWPPPDAATPWPCFTIA